MTKGQRGSNYRRGNMASIVDSLLAPAELSPPCACRLAPTVCTSSDSSASSGRAPALAGRSTMGMADGLAGVGRQETGGTENGKAGFGSLSTISRAARSATPFLCPPASYLVPASCRAARPPPCAGVQVRRAARLQRCAGRATSWPVVRVRARMSAIAWRKRASANTKRATPPPHPLRTPLPSQLPSLSARFDARATA